VTQKHGQQPAKGHGGGGGAATLQQLCEELRLGNTERRGLDNTGRQKSAELLAPVEKIFRFRAVRRGTVKGRFNNVFIVEGNAEPRAELAQFFLV